MTIYQQIKSRVLSKTPDQADRYIDNMYNAGVITASQLAKLDDVIFKMRLQAGEYDA